MTQQAKLVKGLDQTLYERLKEEVRRQNGGKTRSRNGPTCGSILNDLIRAYLDHDGRDPYATQGAGEHLRTMLRQAIDVARGNQAIYGETILTQEDIDRVVTRVLARAGKIHTETRRRYRQSLISGYLRENAMVIDGVRIVDYRVDESYMNLYG